MQCFEMTQGSAVNRLVAGSIPARGAILFFRIRNGLLGPAPARRVAGFETASAARNLSPHLSRQKAKKMRPGVSPAPRRWVMVGCLQGRHRHHADPGLTKT